MNKAAIVQFLRDLKRAILLVWKADPRITLVNIGLQSLQALLPVVSLYFIKSLIEIVTESKGSFADALPLVIMFGAVQLLLAIVGQITAYISVLHQQKLANYLAEEVITKATEVDYAYYENPKYHDTLHLAQQQSLYKATQLQVILDQVLLNSLSLLFLVGFFFTLNSLFALLFVFLSVPLAVIKWYSGYSQIKLEKKFVPLEREANYLNHVLTGIEYAKEVRIFGFANIFLGKFRNIRSLILKEKRKLHARLTWYSLLAEAAEIIAMATIFGLLTKYAWDKKITIGFFVIYIQGFQRLQSTSKNFLQALVQLVLQRVFLKDLFTFFDIPVKITASGNNRFPELKNGLSLEQVSFTYPQTNRKVLHDISLHCAPGSVIAIVGENGSGKSTLVKLLARIYDLQSGSISIEHEPVSHIRIEDYRKNVLFLFQDFEKYFLTIEENIALGEGPDILRSAAIEEAAQLSGAAPFVSRLSKGYKTRMGRIFHGSEQLSGGQWQKLALARLFYKKAQLIVLDEPTSALDPTAELELFNNIQKHRKDKIIVLISHRLYNLKIADRIYVMQEGRITEEGSFDELVSREGAFKKMYDAQKL